MRRGGRAVRVVLVLAALLGAGWLWLGSPPAPIQAPPPAQPTRTAPAPRLTQVPQAPAGSGQITGRVRNSRGEPIADVDLEVIRLARPSLPPACARLQEGCACGEELEEALAVLDQAFVPLAKATSGPDGRFTLTGVPEDTFELRASSATHFATAEVRLNGASAQVELRLDRPLSDDLLVVSGGDEDEEVPGAAFLAVVEGRIVDYDRAKPGYSTSLMAPTRNVVAIAPGFAPAAPPESSSTFESADGGVTRVTAVQMRRGKLLRGRLESGGTGVGGVTIRASSRAGRALAGCATAITAADGTWVLGPIPMGSYLVTAQDGARGARASVSTVDPGPADASVELKLRETVRTVLQVLDGQGTPVPAAQVRVTWFPLEGGAGDTTALLADSVGRLEQVTPPGQIRLAAKAPGFLESTLEQKVIEGEWRAELRLETAGRVTGRVVSSDGLAVERANLIARFVEPAPSTQYSPFAHGTTGEDGEFSIETPKGDLELQALAQGMMTTNVRVRSPASGLELVLQRGGVVEGRVIDASGRGAAGVWVTVACPPQGSSTGAAAREDGTFRVGAVPDGACEVRAELSDSRGVPRRVEQAGKAAIQVVAARAPFVELRLERIKMARGRVVDETGRPLAGVTVVAVPGDYSQSLGALPYDVARSMLMMQRLSTQAGPTTAMGPSATSGNDGAFALEGLSQRPHTLSARANGLAEDPEARAVIQPGSEAVVLVLVRPRFLTAHLTDGEGRPIARVRLGNEGYDSPGGELKVQTLFNYTGVLGLSAEGFLPVSKQVTLSTRADTPLGTVRLERGRMVTAKITNARTGAPLSGGVAVDDGVSLWTQTGTLEFAAPHRAFVARVRLGGYLDAVVEVGAEQRTFAVALDPGSVITGTARGPDGRPPEFGSHSVLVTGCPKTNYSPVEATGTFRVRGVAPGTCRVRLVRTGTGAQAEGPEKTVVVPARGEASVDLVTGSGR